MPEGHQYETVSGFVCEAFGYIPKTGESVTVVLEKENWEEHDEHEEGKHERQDQKEKHQVYRLEILAGNARKVSAVRFERVSDMNEVSDAKNMVPKFVRKWGSEEEHEGNHQAKIAVSDEHLTTETASVKKEN
ncbi:unnamed protein product [Microthlaspi erraticum]|nr:unnamed protein product [Microthlaspi erraticum]